MSDTKISALTAVTTPTSASEFAVNEGGTSKKMTLAQVVGYSPPVPTVVAVTAEFTSTGVPTATLPTGHTTNDVLVLVLQTANDGAVTAPAGYTNLGPQNGVGLSAAAGSAKLCVFWKRDGGAESAPTIPDTGDHTYGFMFAVRGCPTTGDPFHLQTQAQKRATSTTGTSGKGRTSLPNCLIAAIFAHAWDNTTANATGAANADLTSVTEQFDDSTSDGTGGGLVLITGTLATPGKFGATTLTWTNTTVDVSTVIAFIPDGLATYDYALRRPEVQTFFGTGADLDDSYVIPPGATRIFAQICDGGGSGSGGNTSTTAEGGGGGGGGGYDEAWYDPDQLTSPVTVHAGKGGAVGTALNQAGNIAVISQFDKGNQGPLSSTNRIAGTASTAAASAAGGAGGCGSGRGTAAIAVGARIDLTAATAGVALGGRGGRGGTGGTAAIVAGSPADWGGGGGESGSDTDANTLSTANGYSCRGAGGGGGGRTTTNVGVGGTGGGAIAAATTQGTQGPDSTRLPYGGSGGCGGGSSVVTGGTGGFPGGGGGGGGGNAGGYGGKGGDGCVVVTSYF